MQDSSSSSTSLPSISSPASWLMGLLAVFFTGKKSKEACLVTTEETETLKDVVIRGAKVYLFVAALLLLGGGMKIVIDKYLLTVRTPDPLLGEHDLRHIGQCHPDCG